MFLSCYYYGHQSRNNWNKICLKKLWNGKFFLLIKIILRRTPIGKTYRSCLSRLVASKGHWYLQHSCLSSIGSSVSGWVWLYLFIVWMSLIVSLYWLDGTNHVCLLSGWVWLWLSFVWMRRSRADFVWIGLIIADCFWMVLIITFYCLDGSNHSWFCLNECGYVCLKSGLVSFYWLKRPSYVSLFSDWVSLSLSIFRWRWNYLILSGCVQPSLSFLWMGWIRSFLSGWAWLWLIASGWVWIGLLSGLVSSCLFICCMGLIKFIFCLDQR